MNESFGQKSTVATIGGAKETLVFGTRYTLRYGADDAVLRGALLGERAANGDLVFFDTLAGTRSRVRPSTIDSLVPSTEVVGIPDGESAVAYVDRVEKLLGSAYVTFAGSDEGQRALAAAASEDRAGRNGKVSRRAAPEKVADVLSTIYPGVVATSRTVSLDDLAKEHPETSETTAGVDVEVAAEREVELDPVLSKPLPLPKLTKRGKAKLVAAGADPELVAKATTAEEAGIPVHAEPGSLAARVLDAGRPSSKGRPYAERNQVWKCGECKRRTRQPVCENGHAPVAAPAGKRREDRGAK